MNRAVIFERGLQQVRNNVRRLNGSFLGVGEGSQIFAVDEKFPVAKLDVDQSRRSVADCRDNSAAFVNFAGDPVDRRAVGKVPHDAVSARKKYRVEVGTVHVVKLERVGKLALKVGVVPKFFVDRVAEVEAVAVNGRFAALNRRKHEVETCRRKFFQRVSQLAQPKARWDTRRALDVVARHDAQNFFHAHHS